MIVDLERGELPLTLACWLVVMDKLVLCIWIGNYFAKRWYWCTFCGNFFRIKNFETKMQKLCLAVMVLVVVVMN